MKIVSTNKTGKATVRTYSKAKSSGKELTKSELRDINYRVSKTGVAVLMTPEASKPLTSQIKMNVKEGDNVVAVMQSYVSPDCVVVLKQKNEVIEISEQEVARNLEVSNYRDLVDKTISIEKRYLDIIFKTYIFLKRNNNKFKGTRFETLKSTDLMAVASKVQDFQRSSLNKLESAFKEVLTEASYVAPLQPRENFFDNVDEVIGRLNEQINHLLTTPIEQLDFSTDHILCGEGCRTVAFLGEDGIPMVAVIDLFKGENYEASVKHLEHLMTKANPEIKRKIEKDYAVKEVKEHKQGRALFYIDPKFLDQYDKSENKGYAFNGELTTEMKKDGIERKPMWGSQLKDRLDRDTVEKLLKRKNTPALQAQLPKRIRKKLELQTDISEAITSAMTL